MLVGPASKISQWTKGAGFWMHNHNDHKAWQITPKTRRWNTTSYQRRPEPRLRRIANVFVIHSQSHGPSKSESSAHCRSSSDHAWLSEEAAKKLAYEHNVASRLYMGIDTLFDIYNSCHKLQYLPCVMNRHCTLKHIKLVFPLLHHPKRELSKSNT